MLGNLDDNVPKGLRLLEDADNEELVKAVNESSLKNLKNIPDDYSVEVADAYISRSKLRWESRQGIDLVILDSSRFAGMISISLDRDYYIGYWLRTSSRGKGLVKSAVFTLTNWVGKSLSAPAALSAQVRPGNDVSRNILESNGFNKVSEDKEYIYFIKVLSS